MLQDYLGTADLPLGWAVMIRKNVLVINTDIDVRMRLTHAFHALADLGEVSQSSTLNEAFAKLTNSRQKPELIFISYQFPMDEITQFLQEASALEGSAQSGFIVIRGSREDKDAVMTSHMMAGADGVLFEPFSTEELVAVTAIASRMKGERRAAREIVTLKFMIREIVKYVDLLACLRASNCDPAETVRRLEEIQGKLRNLDKESLPVYYSLLTDAVTLLPNPQKPAAVYKGNSKFVRRRMESRLLDRADKGPPEPEPHELLLQSLLRDPKRA
jgi:DNA-binding response OmpR family regulator